jgi:hypothetical protein
MWPFKKKVAVEAAPSVNTSFIKQLRDWRGVGDEFTYLGRRMVVTGHFSISGGYPVTYIRPGFIANYVDDTGVIRQIHFGAEESRALMDRAAD